MLGCIKYFAAIAEKKDMSHCYDSVFHLLCLAHLGVDLPCVVGILFGILCCSYVFSVAQVSCCGVVVHDSPAYDC